jgi:hypothetical protein
MRTIIQSNFQIFFGVTVISGCQKVGEPWDSSGYFEEHRTRTAEQQAILKNRMANTKGLNRLDQPWVHAQH